MIRRTLFLAMLLASTVATAEPIELKAADGVAVHGEYWPAADAHAPIVVAFHQAGANHAEYTPLAPRLNAAGFGVLAIDQRSGGSAFGGTNRTVAALGHSTGFDAALPDLEAALAWAHAKADGAPVVIWGSSYSAALVFRLAAKHPADVAGLIAFSPGEFLDASNAVHTAARGLTMPIFVDEAKDREEIAAARSIVAAAGSADKTQFVPVKGGVHGSSTLRPERNPAGAEENWTAVLAFLEKFKNGHRG